MILSLTLKFLLLSSLIFCHYIVFFCSFHEQIAKDAKECVQECVSEFISFITSEYPFSSNKDTIDRPFAF